MRRIDEVAQHALAERQLLIKQGSAGPRCAPVSRMSAQVLQIGDVGGELRLAGVFGHGTMGCPFRPPAWNEVNFAQGLALEVSGFDALRDADMLSPAAGRPACDRRWKSASTKRAPWCQKSDPLTTCNDDALPFGCQDYRPIGRLGAVTVGALGSQISATQKKAVRSRPISMKADCMPGRMRTTRPR